jgi:beta-glucosidase-like glycosyl hydrolase
MDREARIGRVLMVAPPEDWLSRDLRWLEGLNPAGVVLFRRHVPDDPEALRAGLARLQAWASQRGETLLAAVDEEGGFVTRTGHIVPTPPSARALAWAAEPEVVRDVFVRYGACLRGLGYNMDLAPVCDVNSNPRNPVIGVRAFGSDPELVTRFAGAVQEGLARGGLLSCLKHFPGHGDTEYDSHLTRPVLPHARDRLEAVELPPFRQLLPDSPAVMVAHLVCPGLGDAQMPATLSAAIATRLLRDEMGFEGAALTDDMEMQALAEEFGPAESGVRAVGAGCDLLLYCGDLAHAEEAREGLRRALSSGRIPEKRFDQAIERVDRLRALAAAVGDAAEASEPLPPQEDRAFYRRLCTAALRVENAPAWAELLGPARAGRPLVLAGWNQEVLDKLAGRLRERGFRVEPRSPSEAVRLEGVPLGIVLAERRPLADDALRLLGALAERHPGAGLANLLTPEVDAPVAAAFRPRLRSADCSDIMLDVVADHWAGVTR